MRQILFRGIRRAGECWVYGDLLNYVNGFKAIVNEKDESVVIHETIGQYTRFNTPKGVKIFEGDRVKLHNGGPWSWHPDHPVIEGIVTFMECGFFVNDERTKRAVPLFQEVNWWEITGNIHEISKDDK